MTYKITGKSLLELKDLYGIGKGGFYSEWWRNESFAKEKPEAGEYEIDFTKQLTGMVFAEQTKNLSKGWEVPHVAVIAEAVLSHFKKTGEYLLPTWYTRTSNLDSDGDRVCVGVFGAEGLYVDRLWDGHRRRDSLGVSACKNLGTEINTDNRFPDIIELNGQKYKKI